MRGCALAEKVIYRYDEDLYLRALALGGGSSMRVAAGTLMALGLLGVLGCTARQDAPKATTFSVSFPASVGEAPVDGHVILLLSKDMTREPRTHVEEGEMLAVPFVFGLDVDALAPGQAVVLDDHVFGWPAAHLSAVPTGDYYTGTFRRISRNSARIRRIPI
jgi:hypothetical protein